MAVKRTYRIHFFLKGGRYYEQVQAESDAAAIEMAEAYAAQTGADLLDIERCG